MTTNLWTARAVRLDRIASKLRPSWASKCARITQRLLKPDCWKCGGEDFMHSFSCARRQSYGNSAIAFGNAVIRAEANRSGASSSAWAKHQGRLAFAHMWRLRREYEARTGLSAFCTTGPAMRGEVVS